MKKNLLLYLYTVIEVKQTFDIFTDFNNKVCIYIYIYVYIYVYMYTYIYQTKYLAIDDYNIAALLQQKQTRTLVLGFFLTPESNKHYNMASF